MEIRTGCRGGRSNPELASQEVSELLAAVRGHFFDDDDDTVEPVAGPSGDANGDTSTIQDSLLEHGSLACSSIPAVYNALPVNSYN